jgi:transposase
MKENKCLPKNQQKKKINFIDFYRYNGRKKYFKISIICDSYGVPLEIIISSSKGHDVTTLIKNVNNLPTCLNTLRNSKVNRYKQYLLADSAYLSLKNKLFLIEQGYIPLIAYNKKNTKDEKIIKKNKFDTKQKNIYKNRSTVERSFSWIKNKPIININYQKKIESYEGLLKIACSIITSKRI